MAKEPDPTTKVRAERRAQVLKHIENNDIVGENIPETVFDRLRTDRERIAHRISIRRSYRMQIDRQIYNITLRKDHLSVEAEAGGGKLKSMRAR